MGWNRSATLLSVLLFLAFGFELIGVFSDPVSRGKLPLASHKGYDYGILGYCESKSTGKCSDYGVGYKVHDSQDFFGNSNSQRILSEILVSHIVAAGCLLIAFALGLGTHARNKRYWLAVQIILIPVFLVTLLSFIVEIILFGTKLKFAGWFTLAATILVLISSVALAVMRAQLNSRLGRVAKKNGADMLFGGDTSEVYRNGDEFIVGRDDEKLIKSPMHTTFPQTYNPARAPALKTQPSKKTNGSYEKIPTGNGMQLNQMATGSNSSLAQPLHNNGSVGAVSARSNALQPGDPQNPRRFYQPEAGATGAPDGRNHRLPPLPNGQQGPGNAAGIGAGSGAAAGVAAGVAAGAAAGTMHGSSSDRRRKEEQPNSQDQTGFRKTRDAWSQIALEKSRELDSGSGHGAHDSVATTAVGKVPAGAYVSGIESPTRAYGPNVVKIPKLRQPESATYDYHSAEAPTQAPSPQQKVPNFSRMGNQDASPRGASKPADAVAPAGSAAAGAAAMQMSTPKKNVNPILQRYVESSQGATADPYLDAPMGNYVTASPATSEASHYTSISERQPQTSGAGYDARAQPAYQDYPSSGYNASGYAPQQSYAAAYQQQALAYQQQQAYQGYQGYAQPMYGASPVGYQGYQGYQGMPPQAGYGGAYYQAGYPAPARRPKGPPKMQTSEIALQANPDFDLGSMGKRKKRGGR